MRKFAKLNYSELETKKVDEFTSSFTLQPLERGFGNTIGNAVRRVLLSSISGVSSFAVKIAGVDHEFQTISGVSEDAVQLILNLKDVRFEYNQEVFKDDEIIKVVLKSKSGEVKASDLKLPAGVNVVNPDQYIATTSKNGALELELFVKSGRGFYSFEENKKLVKEISGSLESNLSSGTIIAMDSDFSPVKKVSYESVELNSSSAIVEEKLTINVSTDKSVSAQNAIAEAANIIIQHISTLAGPTTNETSIFAEEQVVEETSNLKSISISMLDLSVRSYNCLRRAGFETLEELSKLSLSELVEIKNLGKKSVEEIIEKLAEYDIVLKEGV